MHFHLFNIASALLPSRFHKSRAVFAKWSGLKIGAHCKMCVSVKVYGSDIQIGSNTWLSPEVSLISAPSAPITIGENCDIGHGAMLVCGSHLIGDSTRRAGGAFSRPIIIGNGCWIGARAVILGGARIGDGSVVAAGAVVLPNTYENNTLLAGVPARTVRHL
jgi:maltose O-acetyltransferase